MNVAVQLERAYGKFQVVLRPAPETKNNPKPMGTRGDGELVDTVAAAAEFMHEQAEKLTNFNDRCVL